MIGVNLFQALAVPRKKCSVIFDNKFEKFLIQEFSEGKEITEVREISEFEVGKRIQNAKDLIIGFQFQKSFGTFDLFEEVNILDIEKIVARAIQNDNPTSNKQVKPFYFIAPRVSISKVK